MSRALLELDSEHLQRVLVAHARKDRAPSGARERVLAGVGAATLWPSIASASASSAGSGSAAAKIGALIAAKWLMIGLGAGVLTLSAAEVISGPSAPSTERIPSSSSAAANAAPRLQALPLADAEASLSPLVGLTPSAKAASTSAAKLDPFAAVRRSNTDARALAESSKSSSLPSVVNLQQSTGASASTNDSPPLTLEVRALEAARAALAQGAAAHAFELLSDYTRAFPHGALRVEGAALYLETVAKRGDPKRALELAEQFLKQHPESPLASRVRALAESYRRSLHNL